MCYPDVKWGRIFFVKRIRVLKPKPLVKAAPSKPKPKLSKADPAFFSKLGSISAEARALPVETFRDMAHKSHRRRNG